MTPWTGPRSSTQCEAAIGCPMCAEGRSRGHRLRGAVARRPGLERATCSGPAIQPGYTIVIWSGRHRCRADGAERSGRRRLRGRRAGRREAPSRLDFRPVKIEPIRRSGNSLPHLAHPHHPRYADDPSPGVPVSVLPMAIRAGVPRIVAQGGGDTPCEASPPATVARLASHSEGVARRPPSFALGGRYQTLPAARSIARSRSIRASIGGCVENSAAIPTPDRGFAM